MCPGHKICVRNRCCACGQTGKHLCRQQCVRNNVSSFARVFSSFSNGINITPKRLRVPIYLQILSNVLNMLPPSRISSFLQGVIQGTILSPVTINHFNVRNKRDFGNELIKKFNAKRFLKHIYKKVNDVSALRYAIIKLRSESIRCEVNI